jgi:hypothetical protein
MVVEEDGNFAKPRMALAEDYKHEYATLVCTMTGTISGGILVDLSEKCKRVVFGFCEEDSSSKNVVLNIICLFILNNTKIK